MKIKVNNLESDKMFDILKPLLSMNVFSKQELETAKPVKNVCEHCEKECGNLFILNNCSTKICGQCLDTFYDNYTPVDNCGELLKCPCHGNLIFSYNVIS